MKKFLKGMALGVAIGVGGAWWFSPGYDKVVIDPLPTTRQESADKSYSASMDRSTLKQLDIDSKAAPCFCSHNKMKIGQFCEHEDLSCTENTAKECETRFKDYTCYAGLAAVIRQP